MCPAVTNGSEGLPVGWCIQWCILGSVFWSKAVRSCCSQVEGSPGVRAEPLRGSSSASSPSHWPSCVFWSTSCVWSAVASRMDPCSDLWSWTTGPGSPDVRWRSRTPRERSIWSRRRTPASWTPVSPVDLQTRSLLSSSPILRAFWQKRLPCRSNSPYPKGPELLDSVEPQSTSDQKIVDPQSAAGCIYWRGSPRVYELAG